MTLAVAAVAQEDPALHRKLLSLREKIHQFRTGLLTGERSSVLQKLGAFQQALFNDIRETFQAIQTQDNSSPLRVEDLPRALRNRVIGVTGKYLLQVYPKHDIWERKAQENFVQQLRQVFP